MIFDGKHTHEMTVEELEAAYKEAERGKQMAENHYQLMLAAQGELLAEAAKRERAN